MDSLFALQGENFVIMGADCTCAYSIMKFKVSNYIIIIKILKRKIKIKSFYWMMINSLALLVKKVIKKISLNICKKM